MTDVSQYGYSFTLSCVINMREHVPCLMQVWKLMSWNEHSSFDLSGRPQFALLLNLFIVDRDV
jgi:hypothetical protein